MSVTAIKKQSAEQLTVEALRDLIISGRLPPGARITETDLAVQFEVSRGTVRVALYQLARDGLVIQKPYVGWAVMSIGEVDIWELYTLRASLESLASRLASDFLDESGAQVLQAAFDDLVTACGTGDVAVITEKDFDLHKQIILLAKHRRLAEQYQLVEQQVRLLVIATYTSPSEIQTVIEHHHPIVEAILSKNSELAARLVGEHSESEGKKVLAHLKSAKG